MRSLASQFAFAVFACTTAPCGAQSPACSPALAWADYTYVQRTTTEGSNVAEAELRTYANARVLHIRFDGVPVSKIIMTARGAEGLELMAGPGAGGPATLGEVGMMLEFPMAEGALRGLAAPCDLADGATRRFDGKDVLNRASQPVEKGAVSGSITRHGLRFSYTLLSNEPLDAGRAAQRWDGVWEKSPGLAMFPLSTDVRNWRVYRDNVLLREPTSQPLTLGALLEEIGAAPVKH